MSNPIIVDNEYVTIQYLPDKKLIYSSVHQPVNEAVFKEALNTGLDALKQYGVCKWLADDRKLGPLSPEFQKWANQDWNGRAVAQGWKYWANVVPKELVAAGTLNSIIESLYQLGLRMRVFSNLEAAIEWLDSIEA